jgi:hypothetical protein
MEDPPVTVNPPMIDKPDVMELPIQFTPFI